MVLYKAIRAYCNERTQAFHQIADDRKAALQQLAKYLQQAHDEEERAQVVVICTHNSRRSHMGQVALAIAATYYGLPNVRTFSGGTEATATYPLVAQAFKNMHLNVGDGQMSGQNAFFVRWKSGMHPVALYSKLYDQSPPNPKSAFAAVLVCNDADENCPYIPNATQRIKLTYEDPKIFDHSPDAQNHYDARLQQVLTEMLYAVSLVVVKK